MSRFIGGAIGALIFMAAAPAAWALDQHQGPIFISPMGQPFQGDDPMQAWITAADTDHDGGVSLAEFQADAAAFFAHADANQDQTVTSVESTALLQREAPQVLSREYMGPPLDPHMQPTGRRHPAQTQDNPATSGSIIIDHPGRRVGPAPRVLTGVARFGLIDVGDAVMSCDTDFSGRVTVTEFTACAARRFADIDADHNGSITIEEARAKRAALVAGPGD